MDMIHATCVAIDRVGVLLRGPSGSGKSDLALRLIDGGAALVADDRVVLSAQDGRLVARAPNAIAGLIEARGLGPLAVRAVPAAPVGLVVDLVAGREVERFPEPDSCCLMDVRLPLVRLDPFEASAPAKVRLAAAHFADTAGQAPRQAPAVREAGGAR